MILGVIGGENALHRAVGRSYANRVHEQHRRGEIPLAPELRCSRCDLVRLRSDFTPNWRKIRGASHHCHSCVRKAAKQCKDKNQANGLCRCGRERRIGFRTCEPCANRTVRRNAKLRQDILTAYGRRCQCPGCDVTEEEFLSIDHIYDDGATHRRALSSSGDDRSCVGSTFYAWLRRNGFPKDRFQLLCMNCNMAKAKGGCPHTRRTT